MISLYAIFGLAEDSSDKELDSAYNALRERLQLLMSDSADEDPAVESRTKKLLGVIENAHKTLKNSELKQLYEAQRDSSHEKEVTESHPRLGQLCVTSGIITMEQLKEAVDCQVKSGMPLGEVLQDMQFITQAELDGLLLGQQMIDAPSGVTEPTALRLISLNLISEDMALIAQIEAKSTGRTIKEIMSRHRWVNLAILNAVLG